MDYYIGTVLIWAPNFAPLQFAYCAGQTLGIAQNTALFSLIGTVYGGNGSTTFMLPDLRSRVPVGGGMGAGNGLSTYPLGVMAGTETVTLNTSQMPIHNHGATGEIVATNANATSSPPLAGGTLATVGIPDGPSFTGVNAYAATGGTPVTLAQGSVAVQTANNGGSQPHENRQPFLGISFIICLQGIFPPRP
ncbi:phage tail protein [Salinarimonas chemoclinalis]|uniref:phage tail protein n=1 Tax=Salinarimonas chemoclinalis TaxID=3241599 RepID=UPI003555CDB8